MHKKKRVQSLSLFVTIFFPIFIATLLTACGGGSGPTTNNPTKSVHSVLTGVSATAGNGHVTISWNPVSDATSYNLYMASVSGVTKSNYSSLLDGMKHEGVNNPFTHPDLTNGKTYYFVVTTVNANGESVESVQVSATPISLAKPMVTSVSAGGMAHTCARLSDGTVKCWGYNGTGSLGNGITTDSSVPVLVNGVTTAIAVSAGGSHSCALLSDGRVKCWGSNSNGQLGDGTTTDSFTPVTVSGINTAIAIEAADSFTCALLSDGTVKCWGYNGNGELGNGATTDSSMPVTVSGINTATAIDSENSFSCARLSDGTVKCWGINFSGQLGDGTTTDSSQPVTVIGINTATAVAVAGGHSCALLSDGRVKCWGFNGNGELGNGTTSNSSSPPVPVTGIFTASAVDAGGIETTCALLSGGTVKCWGYNFDGQLGNGTTSQFSSTQVGVSGITTATGVSVGFDHSCVVLSDGTVKCWGNNQYGQMGNGTTTNSSTPVTVIGF